MTEVAPPGVTRSSVLGTQSSDGNATESLVVGEVALSDRSRALGGRSQWRCRVTSVSGAGQSKWRFYKEFVKVGSTGVGAVEEG